MPVTRSSNRLTAMTAITAMTATTASATMPYNLRSARPTTGFYTEEVVEEMHTAAATLLSLRSGAVAVAPVRRSTRIANRS